MMNNQTPDPSKFTEEGMAEALKQMEALQQRDAERAAAILTPAGHCRYWRNVLVPVAVCA